MCVSSLNTWNFKLETVGRNFFLFCSKFLHGNNRETVCQNGKISWNPLKIKKKS